jgi:transcriptional regulator with XRE-family HTH domain
MAVVRDSRKIETGRSIAAIRAAAGLSQRDLAYALGCTAERLSRLERGVAKATPEELDRLEQHLERVDR